MTYKNIPITVAEMTNKNEIIKFNVKFCGL